MVETRISHSNPQQKTETGFKTDKVGYQKASGILSLNLVTPTTKMLVETSSWEIAQQ